MVKPVINSIQNMNLLMTYLRRHENNRMKERFKLMAINVNIESQAKAVTLIDALYLLLLCKFQHMMPARTTR